MSDVFISHSSKDKEIADKVVAFLEDKGLTCWIAPRNILPGSDWAASISTAISASKIFLLIFSGNSAASEQVARELSLAESVKNVFVVPYKVDETELSGSFRYYLTGSHWISANYARGDYKLEELYQLMIGITGKNVQNITNNTYIDNLHIHTDGDPIAAAGQVGQTFSSQQAPQGRPMPQGNPMQQGAPMMRQAPAAPMNMPGQKGKSKLIPILCAAVGGLLLLVILIAVVAGGKSKDDEDYDSHSSSAAAPTEIVTEIQTEAAAETSTTDEGSSDAENTGTLTNYTLNFNDNEATGIYEGELSDAGVPNGKGTFNGTFDYDGETRTIEYTGQFSGGTFSGKGKSIVSTDDGTVRDYNGGFLNGYQSGDATYIITYGEGNSKLKQEYEGSLLNGEISGQGTCTIYYAEDNDKVQKTWEGEFKNTKLNGEGTIHTVYRTGDVAERTEKGTFVNDSLSGTGEVYIVYFDDDEKGRVETTYTGELKNGTPNGQGTYIRIYKDPNEKYVYEGEVKNDKMYTGTQTRYDLDTGEVKEVTTYENGEKVS